MALEFAFNPDQGETPQTLETKRAIALALARNGMNGVAHNAGEGLAKVGNALAYAMAMGNYNSAATAAQKDYGGIVDSLVSGGGAAPAAAGAAATPAPSQPQIPAAAFSGGNLTDTPAPLSGGMPQASASPSLPDAVAKLESGNSPNEGPAGRYVNYRFQQFPAFAKQYGTGADGVLNYAKRVLAANPNATFGDMYGGYVTGTGDPATASIDSLKTTTQPGAQGAYGNLVRNSPIDPKTPLSQLIASNDPNFVPQPAGGMNPQLSALLSPNMTVGQGAFSPPASPQTASGPALAFNGQPPPANPLATPPQANGFAPSPQGQPNITTVPTKPAALPIEGQPQAGRAAVAQALANQPVQAPTAASTIPPNVAATIKRALMSASPQGQALGTALLQKYMQPHQYGFQTLPDGTVVRTDPLSGTIQPVYQSSKPQFTTIGTDQFGNPVHGFVDPITKKVTPAGMMQGQPVGTDGQMPQQGGVPGQNMPVGEAFLQTQPKPVADQVRALAEGRMAFPAGFALKSPYWQHMIQMVSQYDPSFDAINFNARAKTRNDFTSGKSATQLNAMNTVIGHLRSLSDSADKLNNSSFTPFNSAVNYAESLMGDPRYKQFDTTKKAVVDELTRVWRGSGGSEGDIKTWSDQINSANSPQQLHGVIAQIGDLLESKINAMGEQYKQGMGTSKSPIQLITPQSAKVLSVLRQRADGHDSASSNGPSSSGTSPKPGNYKFNPATGQLEPQ